MRLSLAVKTLFRSPLKTLLTFVLLAAAAFMLVYSAADYALTSREYNKAVKSYRGFISVEYGPAEEPAIPAFLFFFLSDPRNNANYDNFFAYDKYHQKSINTTDIDSILKLPYISSVSRRYMTAGVTDGYDRIYRTGEDLNKNYFDLTARFVLEATFDSLYINSFYASSDSYSPGRKSQSMHLKDIKLLAGDPKWLELRDSALRESGLDINVNVALPDFYDKAKAIGQTTGIGRLAIFYRNNHIYTEDLEALVPGRRYIFVGRVEPYTYRYKNDLNNSFFMGDDTLYNWWTYIYPLEGKPDNYLETEEFAPLRELIQITNDDLHTFDAVYTDDMESIKRVAEDRILLTEGRLLNQEDSINKNKVCVVSDVFMKENNLKIGDTIKLKLGDKLFEQYAPVGAVASLRDRYADNFVDAEFEIVGAYVDLNIDKMREVDLYWAYNDYTVFVPLSFLPESADIESHEFKPAEISFIVGDARNIRAFQEECIPQIQAMGLTVYFNDCGWLRLEEQFTQAQTMSISKLLAFSAASILAGALVVYLFIGRKRREYAVMRALGTTKRKAARTLFVPLMLLSLAAVFLGGLASVIYAGQTADKTLKTFAEMGLEVDPSIPVYVVILGMLALLVFVALLALLVLHRAGKKPPLMLLQESTNRNSTNKKNKAATELFDPEEVIVTETRLQELKPIKTGHYNALSHVLHYIVRHSRRAIVKSLLALMLAALISGAMGQFTAARQSYSGLYHNIIIKARFIGGPSYEKALKVADSGYVNSPYYEYIKAGESNFGDVEYLHTDLYFSSDLKRITKEPVEYLEGYDDATVFTVIDKICLLPAKLMEKLGLELGDAVELNSQGYTGILMTYHPEYTPAEMEEAYHNHSVYCKVVGRIMTEAIGDTACIPIAAQSKFGSLLYPLVLDLAEYNLSDYHKADEFRKYAQAVVDSVRNDPPLFLMDTSEADNIYKIYRLIETLYPIAVAIAVLIGAVLPGLIIIQSAKEASIMRVLGTTKRRTRVMLILEQLMLCLLGLILAFAVLAIVNGAAIFRVAGPLGIYCALHFIGCAVGTTIASITVTRRKILELLQVKE